jgi:hypothetical protein
MQEKLQIRLSIVHRARKGKHHMWKFRIGFLITFSFLLRLGFDYVDSAEMMAASYPKYFIWGYVFLFLIVVLFGWYLQCRGAFKRSAFPDRPFVAIKLGSVSVLLLLEFGGLLTMLAVVFNWFAWGLLLFFGIVMIEGALRVPKKEQRS